MGLTLLRSTIAAKVQCLVCKFVVLTEKLSLHQVSICRGVSVQVVVLRSLRSKLAEALAEIHSTATSLHLRVARADDDDHDLHATGRPVHTEQLLQQARKAMIQTSNSCSEVTHSPGHSWNCLAAMQLLSSQNLTPSQLSAKVNSANGYLAATKAADKSLSML